jgi:hypothetical protein
MLRAKIGALCDTDFGQPVQRLHVRWLPLQAIPVRQGSNQPPNLKADRRAPDYSGPL